MRAMWQCLALQMEHSQCAEAQEARRREHVDVHHLSKKKKPKIIIKLIN
jgi:hypothetical protein